MSRSAVLPEGAAGLTRAALCLALAGLALAGCRRPAPEPKAEVRGAWLREPELEVGFDLRGDGSLALFGQPEVSGLAWALTHGELVLSTNGAHKVESNVTRLQLVSLEGNRLELAGDGEPLAGTYRRAQAAHIRGVVTYREWEPLRDDARVIVELSRDGKAVALQTFLTRRQVPIDFDLSVPATDSGAEFEVTARIADRERTWFSAPHPMRVTAGADESVELLLRQGS